MKAEDSETSAEKAGLTLSDRGEPGITRERVEEPPEEEGGSPKISWNYFLPNGKPLADMERIDFLNSLAVPPAWTEVWYCSEENGHIQATGKDSNGRLQYRYHPKWNEYKSILKYQNVDEFAIALNELRREVDADLDTNEMLREKVVAIVVRLIDRYHIRVGSDQYAQENESYGLTTLKEGHVKFWKGKKALDGEIDAVLNFIGKSGKEWNLLIKDDKSLEYILAVTGAHLKNDMGYTKDEIINDGFNIDYEIEMFNDDSDTGASMVRSFARVTEKVTYCLEDSQPDLILSGFDIGANIGVISIPAVKRGLIKKAYAVEPEPQNYNLLKTSSRYECSNSI